jgi:hypothetical protein
MKFAERLQAIGLERERVAVALLALSFFCVLYTLVAASSPPGWRPVFAALAGCYVVAFLAVACQWFWGRWYASGLAWSGTTLGLVSLVMVGWHPALALYAGLHAVVLAMLAGPRLAARYELQAAWRERFAIDEFGVARMRRFVTRASAALPSLIVWALGPREGEGQGSVILTAAVAVVALAGLAGSLRLRTWGLLATALAAMAALLAGFAFTRPTLAGATGWPDPAAWLGTTPAGLALAASLLFAAVVPFAGPLVRTWRSLPR